MDISADLKGFIENGALSLSTVNEHNTPHTIYVMSVKVIGKNKILVTDNYMRETKENISFNKNVSLSILIGDAAYELKGTAEYFSNGPLVEQIKKIPENMGFPCKGAIIISIKKIKKMG